jgi:CHAT domain-containing protein
VYAEEEAREVATMLGAKPLLGPQATKAKVNTNLSKATVVHLATHAYFEPNSPLDSGVVFANGNVLTAREVIDERLCADLLILSACETGMAQSMGGDELAGLGQAFLQAGARSVIVSLWSVNDSATAALMKAFYEARHSDDVDKAQALNQAMTQVREQEKWHHPYYWGAFVLMGDW